MISLMFRTGGCACLNGSGNRGLTKFIPFSVITDFLTACSHEAEQFSGQ